MSTNRLLKVTATPMLVLVGMSLSACAAKQVWVPELEQAQNTYQQISQDTVVSTLAAVELEEARQQLIAAETASDQFKSADVIKHEATLASLRTLIAQQRARALSANHSLQVALGQQRLLPENQIAAATVAIDAEPMMAAATPETPTTPLPAAAPEYLSDEPAIGAALPAPEAEPEVPLQATAPSIEAQLLDLKQQVAALQAQLQYQGLTDAGIAANIIADFPAPDLSPDLSSVKQSDPLLAAELPAAEPLLAAALPAAIETTEHATMPAVVEMIEEPAMAAALPATPPTSEPTPLPSADRLKQELLAVNARANSRGMALTLGERYFADGTARLWGGRAARHLDNVAAILTENPTLNLDIEAHSDNSGNSDANHDLTVNRAIAIKSALVLRGVSPDRLNAAGFGDSRPIAENSTEIGRLQNRRVELVFPDIPVTTL